MRKMKYRVTKKSLKRFEIFSIIPVIKDAQDIELYQAHLFCLILIFSTSVLVNGFLLKTG